ncbi:hypothetical protein FNH22_21990 [Fulvivirga sp. M361]|uniref:tetratricopeptide repeat protein n=1 Tax=Fulvivirga sp. M361 TaxID=2594266 RepID=UPI001179AA28|nr:tetratricopeptide repeat protein [Fulvivirga sp. M361]TRX52386.1 hypothetical protein FNH22_21990 [Fulvivirga sp. M361]
MKYRIVWILMVLSATTVTYAQTQEEIIQQQLQEREQAKKAETSQILDLGVDLMEDGEYEEANEKFKTVLKSSKVVPTNLTFYFGKNSFFLGKYKQSIDWLNKYLELKGTEGRYYQECIELLDMANKAFLALREDDRKNAQEVLSISYDIDCGPSGKVVCPVCAGNTVIIEQGPFGNSYRTCPYSDEHGQLSCEEYNLLLKGQLKPKL